jgi:hypothetical protein
METRRRGQCGGYTGPSARLGSGELSLTDPMGPPRSFVTGEDNGSEGTPDRLGLSRGPEGSLPAGMIGRTYFRRENTPEILDSNPLQES